MLHRPSNVNGTERLARLVELLCRISRRLPIVSPVHPRSRQRSKRVILGRDAGQESVAEIHLVGPLAHRGGLSLQEAARFVITNSGGIQEETFFLWVLRLSLQSSAERPETVSLGTNMLAPGGPAAAGPPGEIYSGRPLQEGTAHSRLGRPHANRRLVDVLSQAWGEDVRY